MLSVKYFVMQNNLQEIWKGTQTPPHGNFTPFGKANFQVLWSTSSPPPSIWHNVFAHSKYPKVNLEKYIYEMHQAALVIRVICLSGNLSAMRRCKRHGFDPWVGKIPWHREWQPTPVRLPGKSQGQRSLAGHIQSTGVRVGHDLATKPPPHEKQSCHLFQVLMKIRNGG